jgi:putative NADH-flavin reductase
VVLQAANDLDWTSLSPAALIQPGERTGKFRPGLNQLITDPAGESRISVEDYANARSTNWSIRSMSGRDLLWDIELRH